MSKVKTDDIPQGKCRAIERVVRNREEASLGDFDSFDDAVAHVKETFRAQKPGWYRYYVYNDKGTLIYSVTTTKKKWFIFTKTTFVSETYSFR